MAPHFKEMTWTLADLEDRHKGIQMWLNDYPRVNLRGPVEYEIGKDPLPQGAFDAVFTANTLHIISWSLCLQLFDDIASLPDRTLFLVYGAFKYKGEFTSESNRDFQTWIQSRFPEGGLRHFEKVREELQERQYRLRQDHEMPANNRLLVFEKQSIH
jgi:hypothetical protein